MQYFCFLFQLAAAVTSVAFCGTSAFSIPGEIDVDALYSRSTFTIPPADLISRAKQVLSPQVGIGTKDNGQCLAEDFEFCAAVVGPLGKEDYLGALKSFSLDIAFDIQQNYYGFYVDPLQTNRVWFFTRQIAKHIAEFAGVQPTGKELTLPPQLMHLDFNEDGLVKEFGFYTVDRRQGNTGGLGGAFGYFYGVGKPLPIREAMPYKPSLRFRMLQLLGALAKKFKRNSNVKGEKK